MRFDYVEFKEMKNFRQYPDGAPQGARVRGINKGTTTAKGSHVITEAEWDLEQSGGMLVMRHKGAGWVYTCPMADVKLALVAEEEERKPQKAKAAVQ